MLGTFQYVNSPSYVHRLAKDKLDAEGFYQKIAERHKREEAKIRKLAADTKEPGGPRPLVNGIPVN